MTYAITTESNLKKGFIKTIIESLLSPRSRFCRERIPQKIWLFIIRNALNERRKLTNRFARRSAGSSLFYKTSASNLARETIRSNISFRNLQGTADESDHEVSQWLSQWSSHFSLLLFISLSLILNLSPSLILNLSFSNWVPGW